MKGTNITTSEEVINQSLTALKTTFQGMIAYGNLCEKVKDPSITLEPDAITLLHEKGLVDEYGKMPEATRIAVLSMESQSATPSDIAIKRNVTKEINLRNGEKISEVSYKNINRSIESLLNSAKYDSESTMGLDDSRYRDFSDLVSKASDDSLRIYPLDSDYNKIYGALDIYINSDGSLDKDLRNVLIDRNLREQAHAKIENSINSLLQAKDFSAYSDLYQKVCDPSSIIPKDTQIVLESHSLISKDGNINDDTKYIVSSGKMDSAVMGEIKRSITDLLKNEDYISLASVSHLNEKAKNPSITIPEDTKKVLESHGLVRNDGSLNDFVRATVLSMKLQTPPSLTLSHTNVSKGVEQYQQAKL
jgi:hypothetical protein